MKYKASVVIPIYNGEKYLVRCVESILNQTYAEYTQIILINDGSNDHTDDICKQYELNNTNVLYIKKENAGVWQARKTGLNRALGEWISFVDCDDWCDQRMMELLVRAGEEQNCQMVVSAGKNHVLNHDEAVEAVAEHTYIGYTLHGELFRTELLKQCYDNTLNITRGEDTIVNAKYITSDQEMRVALIEEQVYNYCSDNPNSLSKVSTAKSNFDMGLYLNEMASICRDNKFNDLARKYYNDYLNFMIISNKLAVVERNKILQKETYKRFRRDCSINEKYVSKLKAVLFLTKILNNKLYVKHFNKDLYKS